MRVHRYKVRGAGDGAAMKAYWMAAGAGLLLAIVGMVVWYASDERFGLILVLSGLVLATLGLVMRLIQWGIDKSK